VRILPAGSLRFPGEGSSAQGKSGPKSRLKSVDDGQLVDIPIPPVSRYQRRGTQKGRHSGPLVVPVEACRERIEANPGSHILRGDREGK
jgi:hypothetical protein